MDDRAARAQSFGTVAAEYERGRPGYPDEAVRWLVGTERCRVLDLGAGTGKLTRQLALLGHEVTAVEPSAEMLAQLVRAVPGVTVHRASAERLPLPDETVDAAVAAQAFHWFDPGPALPEIARVLRPGGRFGLVWNMRDDELSWVARLSEIIGGEGFGEDYDPVASLRESPLFGDVEETTFRLEQRVDRDGLRDLISSRSGLAIQQPEERDRVLRDVERLYHEVAGDDGVVLPYVTYVFRTHRVP